MLGTHALCLRVATTLAAGTVRGVTVVCLEVRAALPFLGCWLLLLVKYVKTTGRLEIRSPGCDTLAQHSS